MIQQLRKYDQLVCHCFKAIFEDSDEVTNFVKCKIESLVAQHSPEKPKEGKEVKLFSYFIPLRELILHGKYPELVQS